MQFSTTPFQKRVEKPWGHELIFSPEGLPYTGKVIFVKSAHRWSLHYHEQKKETVCLFSGNALIWLEDAEGKMQKIPMVPFHGYTIEAGQKHRLEAIEDSYIFEASMPEAGTSVRVEDDFARPNETEDLRKHPNRGWATAK